MDKKEELPKGSISAMTKEEKEKLAKKRING